ncbi:MAG TPA: DUF2608 domain-containing protein [Rickettsia endosymbiont of Pyrocoelia pectoralis]|nr:DUF2608 domain-containing protein [Rickettsia endosymbiont of Pyrocoelia pectoralis]
MLKKYISILILLTASIAKAEIIEVNNFDKIKQDFEENYNKNYLPKDLLVVIDLDRLLFKSLLSTGEQFNNDLYSGLIPAFKKINKDPKNIYIDQLILTNDKYKKELKDPEFSDFVSMITKDKIPAIGLNKNYTGNFNNIPKFEIWFADYLKKNFKIDFSNSFSENNYVIFNNLKSFSNTYPVFYKGILTSNNVYGSELLLNFLIQMHFMPKTFIMISSSRSLLSSMKMQLANYSSSVLFIGYYYNNPDKPSNNDPAYYAKLVNDLIDQMGKIKRNNPVIKNSTKK